MPLHFFNPVEALPVYTTSNRNPHPVLDSLRTQAVNFFRLLLRDREPSSNVYMTLVLCRQLLLRALVMFMTIVAWTLAHGEQLATPEKVVTGVYVNNIHSIDLKSDSFVVDFYIWFRWKKDDLKPYETFEIINGDIQSKTGLVQKTIKGVHYAAYRVLGLVHHNWDVRKYPLDSHKIRIDIEDTASPTTAMVYVADTDNTTLSSNISLPSWKIDGKNIRISETKYLTNYGDPTIQTNAESRYSRFTLEITLKREGIGYFLKLFAMLFVATGVCFLSFRIKATDLDPRFGLPIGAIFAAAASEFTVVSGLPETNDITMADWLHINSMIFIMLTIFASTITLRLCNSVQEEKAVRLDKLLGLVFPVVYALTTILIIAAPIG